MRYGSFFPAGDFQTEWILATTTSSSLPIVFQGTLNNKGRMWIKKDTYVQLCKTFRNNWSPPHDHFSRHLLMVRVVMSFKDRNCKFLPDDDDDKNLENCFRFINNCFAVSFCKWWWLIHFCHLWMPEISSGSLNCFCPATCLSGDCF